MSENIDKFERRMSLGELRVDDAKKRRLAGYAIVFNKPSVNLGGFVEQIAPDAVDRTLRENIDVRAFFDHNSGQVLGRLSVGTLRMEKDRRGLHVHIDVPDTTVGNDVMTSVDRGDITGMSFGFRVMPDGQEWDGGDEDVLIRTITDMRVSEVSVVAMPAYPDTSIAVRAMQQFKDQRLVSPDRVEYLRRLHRQRLAGA